MSVLSRLEQDRQRPGVSCPRCFGSRLLIVQGRDIAQATFCPECTKTCETCGGSGTVFDRNELGSVDASPCPDCSPLRAQIQLYNKAQIPRRYHDATFGDFEWQHDASLHEAYMRKDFDLIYEFNISHVRRHLYADLNCRDSILSGHNDNDMS